MAAIPTLCEVNYDVNVKENSTLGIDDIPVKYRCSSRLSTGAHSRLTPSNAARSFELDTSHGYVQATESYLVGRRTPPYPTLRSHTVLGNYPGSSSATLHRPLFHSDHATDTRGFFSPTPQDLLDPSYSYGHYRHSTTSNGVQHEQKRKTRAKTAPPLPSSMPEFPQRLESAENWYSSETVQKLQWVPALNTWVTNNQSKKSIPYVSFVNSVNLLQRADSDKNVPERNIEDLPVLPCSRFLSHMSSNCNGLAKSTFMTDKKPTDDRQRSRRKEAQTTVPVRSRRFVNTNPATANSSKVTTEPSNIDDERLRKKSDFDESNIAKNLNAEDLSDVNRATVDDVDQAKNDGHGSSEMVTPDVTDRGNEDLTNGMSELQLGSPTPPPLSPLPPSPQPIASPSPPPPPPPKIPTPVPSPLTPPTKAPTPTPPPSPLPTVPTPTPPSPPPTPPTQSPPPRPPSVPDPPPVSRVQVKEEAQLQLDVSNEPPQVSKIPSHGGEKRQRWRAQKVQKKAPVKEAPPPKPAAPQRKTSDWIFDSEEDFSTPLPEQEPEVKDMVPDLPKPPTPVATPPPPEPEPPKVTIKTPEPPKPEKKKKRGKAKKDSSLADELKRQKLAEERRKALAMFEKMKKKNIPDGGKPADVSPPRFQDYGWLAKYCIFNSGHLEMYRRAFDAVDEGEKGYLSFMETFMGLRGINRGLTDTEEEYMFRILELAGYRVTDGADFKLFAVMAAISQRIVSVDNWMRNLIGRIDMQMLTMKMFMVKTLWDQNVDEETNRISIDQLCVELRAGGVSLEHETEVREKLGHLKSLDLMDFLTYLPLFIMIHESVVDNPLDDSRKK